MEALAAHCFEVSEMSRHSTPELHAETQKIHSGMRLVTICQAINVDFRFHSTTKRTVG